MSPIKKYFYTIKDLLIGFKCAEGILASKYGYGYTAIWSSFSGYFFVKKTFISLQAQEGT